MIYSILLIIFISITGACRGDFIGSVDRENLFTLDIGPMEDQIALYRKEGDRGIKRTGFTMRDGLFYITDGNSGKIVRYNSYGDLLVMIYNEETNPAPFTLTTNIQDDEQATRWAFTYPLEMPGWIAVDSRRHIFVEDKMPPQAHRYDPESNALLDSVVLHFDQSGRFVNYLGREGIGGSPFPRIVGLATSVRDELAVICRVSDGWNIYWYNSSGMLLYLIKIDIDGIPMNLDQPDAHAVIDQIFASADSRHLYIKADYTRSTFDQSTNTRTGSQPVSSVIWILDIEDGTYTGHLELPLFELSENNRPSGTFVFYSMLGVMRGGKVLLSFPVDTGYSVLFADLVSGEHVRGFINFSNNELIYNDFFLSAEGILCAMLADAFNVNIVWWRTDRFFGDP